MKRAIFALALLATILFSGVTPTKSEAQQPDYVRVFIDLSSRINITDRSMINALGGNVRWEFVSSNTISIEVPAQALPYLMQFGGGRFFNVRLEPTATVFEDTLDWGVDQINAEQVWGGAENAVNVIPGGNGGQGVKVAIIDTGFDRDHPDLQANIAGGWNFVNNSSNFEDDNGHGTHVAGTVAARDNGNGVIGVAPNASIYGLKVLNAAGSGSFGDIVKAIEWASGLNGGTKVDIISMSLGCYHAPQPTACHDPALQAAINAAVNAGVLVVVAAGNSGAGTDTVGYPAQYPATIAVASTTSSNARSSFSSTGPQVDIAAPGSSILSTYPNNTYATLNGTSMATPHVSGVAALVKAANPGMTVAQLRARLQNTATDLGTAGVDNNFGYGLVNAVAAVGSGGTPPPPPAPFLGCNAQAAVTASAGNNNGYEGTPANACTDGSGNATDTNSGNGTSTSCTSTNKDRHDFYNFSTGVNQGATIQGIEVRLDASADSTSSSPSLCVQLSWNGGASWTTITRQTSSLTTSEATYVVGTSSDTWGRTWTSSELSNGNFRVRVIDVSSSTSRDFRLDWVAVRITSTGGTTPLVDNTPPTVATASPAGGAIDVAQNATVSAGFSEPLDPNTVSSSSFSLSGPGGNVAGSVSYANQTATFTPSALLALDTTYTATISTAVRDLEGNTLQTAEVWSFRTVPDTTPPSVTQVVPSNGATSVAVNSTVRATFSEALNPSTVNTNTFKVTGPGAVAASGSLSYAANAATFTPSPALAGGTTYTVELTSGVQDVAGNPLSPVSWSFTTAIPPTTTAFFNCSAQTAVTSSAGDNNGYESSPANACTDGNGIATDTNSGSGTSTSCTNTAKDKHTFYNYNALVNTGAAIQGIEVRLDASADSASSSPSLCVQLSWDGGASWTAVKQTGTLSTGEATYILGSSTDTWGRTWNSSQFSNANFRIRVINVSSSTSRDFRLDWVTVRITSVGGTPPVLDTSQPEVTGTSPSNGATGVAQGSTVTATFNEELNAGTVNTSTFRLTGPGSTQVPGSVSYNGTTATFTPSTALAGGVTYTANLTAGIQDGAGNPLSATSWSFTTAAPPPVTPFLNCGANAAVTSSAGDNNGYTNGANACADGGGNATDTNSGNGTSTSCTSTQKDRHNFYNYNTGITSGTVIAGIEVRLDAWADSASNAPHLCVQLSWNGGTSWTAAKETANLTTSQASYVLGSSSDTWGRNWTASELSNANFRVRVINVSSNNDRDFSLDWVGVRITTGEGIATEPDPEPGDTTPPSVTSVSPANGATGVATNSTIRATFSEPMNAGTVTTANFQVRRSGVTVPGSLSYNASTNVATFTPSSALLAATTYSVTLTSAIQDVAGNSLSQVPFSFATAGGPTTSAWLNCSANAAVTSSAGDNDGFTSGTSACADGGSTNATDTNSGNGTSTSCTSTQKDRHNFYNYNASVPSGSQVRGIEVRLDAWADSTSGSPTMCVQLSWNGGTSWTTAKQTPVLTTSQGSYILGGATDTWGRTWTASELSNANFRVRVIDVASSTSRDFTLDWVTVRITTQ